jgi:hypothetical protein
LFADEQNGFRSKRSCEDHLFVLSSIIRQRKASKLQTFVAFVDMEKAFDRVDRDLLLFKLLSLGIDEKLYRSLQSMYMDCEAAVNVNGYVTSFFI